MSMSTGQKVALGCGCAVLLAGGAVAAFLAVGAYWAKGKLQQAGGALEGYTAKAEGIEKWEKQANANPFTAPADGVIQEAQLRSFLDVRKDIYAVYERHKAEFESLAGRTRDSKELNLSQTIEAGSQIASLVADVRLAQAKALAGHGMSEEEYRYIQVAVYKTFYASTLQKETGKLPSELAAEVVQQGQEAVRESAEAARRAGVAGAEATSPADVEKAEQAVAEAGAGIRALDTPRANLELFRKYEAEIQKYAMHGLAFAGL